MTGNERNRLPRQLSTTPCQRFLQRGSEGGVFEPDKLRSTIKVVDLNGSPIAARQELSNTY